MQEDERKERRRTLGERREEEIRKRSAKTGMCRRDTCHGGKGLGGYESTTDRHFERQRASGEFGVQPPEQLLRLRKREWDQKVERKHATRSTALAEQCKHSSSSSSSSRSNAHAVRYFNRAGQARRPRCQDQTPYSRSAPQYRKSCLYIPTCPEQGCSGLGRNISCQEIRIFDITILSIDLAELFC